MAKVKRPHYVSNKEFFAEMVQYKNDLEVDPNLSIPDCICEKILKICNKLAFKSNFINYTYRDDMVGDAIENCITYIKNFNPEKSNNPFAYFTRIAYFAYLRRIAKEKKVTRLKAKYVQNLPTMDSVFVNVLMDHMANDDVSEQYNDISKVIQSYYEYDLSDEKKLKKPGPKKTQKEQEQVKVSNF